MIDRARLAISGGLLAAVSFVANAGLLWIEYQQDVDASQTDSFDWVPNYWQYLRNGFGLSTQILFALGVVMVVVALSMRSTHMPDDAIFRPGG